MLYFFILPAYVAFLVVVSIASAALYFQPLYRQWGFYGLAFAAGSVPGFLTANLILWFVMLRAMDMKTPEWLRSIHSITVAVVLFVGPLPVSAIGILAGSLIGVYLAHRIRTRALVPEV